MSSSQRTASRTNSVYVDAPEFPVDHADETTTTNSTAATTAGPSEHSLTTQHAHSLSPEPSAQTPSAVGNDDDDEISEEEDEEDESEDVDDDQEESSAPEERGRSQRGRTPNATSTEEDEDDDEEEMVMQVDPSTGLQRATSIPRVRNRSSSLANRLRRQHQRMTSSSGSSSRASRPSSTSTHSGPPAGQPVVKASSARLVDEKDQAELRRKIMDIQRDPTISFADKASMIQKLMSSRWQGAQSSSSSSQVVDDSTEATEEDLKTTYNVRLRQFKNRLLALIGSGTARF
ncbi:MAG: hypothetical protein J3R72DRAFT_211661 [Linnemannia gamsii]|nr:MAG: hypothetical protein J3R72DRAFT_211661 [Linnemannia gamsii]